MSSPIVARGLEGVVVAENHICIVDGVNGRLYYRGYTIADLAENCSYEETAYLLLYGELPNSEQLAGFSTRMRSSRELAEPVVAMMRAFPPTAHPMELLQSIIAYLSGTREHTIHHSPNCNCLDTLHQVVQLASVVATCGRLRRGQDYVPPRDDLSHGANFLYMLHGEEPSPLEGQLMDKSLVLHAEHGFNASTFTARVVASTMSTCYSSISSAIGSLYGSLHGGANEKVVEQMDEIGDPASVTAWVDAALAARRRIMGMGHRVYKVKDPRAVLMEGYLKQLSEARGDLHDYQVLTELERLAGQRMASEGKPVFPNVDFYSGALYRMLGIESILFTPIFAMSRIAGWLAHIMEQRADNRLFRPRSLYVGVQPRPFVPMAERR
jgi:citrate synthase